MNRFIKKWTALLIAAAMLCSLAACGGGTAFSFATTLQDGQTDQAEYTFTASAMYGGALCALQVTCNGTELEPGEGKYTAELSAGLNTIVLTARSGSAEESRSYTVEYLPGFLFETDLREEQVVTDASLTFTASATYGGESCALSVACNGAELAAEGKAYTAALSEGFNTVVLTARCGGSEQSRRFVLIRVAAEGFFLATDLREGQTADEAELFFRAEAFFDGAGCDLAVSVNGEAAQETEGGFVALLNLGENTLEFRMESGKEVQTEVLTVRYRKDFSIVTDLETAEIRNGILSFSLSALFNDAACAVFVSHNGSTLTPSGEGSYAAALTEGVNTFAVTARSGEHVLEKDYQVDYLPIWFSTDLTEQDTAVSRLSFRAAAVRGNEEIPMTVTVNGEPLEAEADGITYGFTMPEGGEYRFLFSAAEGRTIAERTITVRLVDAPPYFEELTLTDGAQLRGKTLTFSVIARDGLGAKLDDSQLSFQVDLDAEDGAERFVSVPDSEVHLVWSDAERTSFRLNLDEGLFASCLGVPFLLRVTADSFGKQTSETFELTYVGPGPDGEIGRVVLAVEGFSIGCGYFQVPVFVTIYEDQPFAVTLCNFFEANGWSYANTGTPESGFYLSRIIGMDLTDNSVPESLRSTMAQRGLSLFSETISPETSGPNQGLYDLGEFDYSQGSGWMYSVNGVFPNYGFSDYFPQDGDVVRLQFTLWYGSDLGGGSALGGGGANFLDCYADYAPILRALAELREEGFSGRDESVYREVLNAVSVWDATQAEINEQLAKLKAAYGEER